MRGGWAAVPMPAPRRPPFPQRQPAPALPPHPPRLRQFEFWKKHTRTQAREPPTQASVGFLLAGRSGRFADQEQRSGARPCFFPCPASCLHAWWTSWAGCSLGARLVLASACAHLWHEFGLRFSHGAAAVSRSQPCLGGIMERRGQGQGPAPMFGYRRAGQGVSMACWALRHSWAMLLTGAPSFTKNTAFVYF